jgi:hypothetical protein
MEFGELTLLSPTATLNRAGYETTWLDAGKIYDF